MNSNSNCNSILEVFVWKHRNYKGLPSLEKQIETTEKKVMESVLHPFEQLVEKNNGWVSMVVKRSGATIGSSLVVHVRQC